VPQKGRHGEGVAQLAVSAFDLEPQRCAAPGKVGPLWLRQPSGIVSAKFRVLTCYLLDAGQSTSSKADGRANMQTGSEQPTSKTAFFDPDGPRPTSLGGRACILEAHLISGWDGDIMNDEKPMVNVITYSSAKARMRGPASREGLG
jgi:hypothetical protein